MTPPARAPRARARGGARRALALLGSAHPAPTVVVTLVTLGLSVAVRAPALPTVLLTLGVLADHLSVGWSNDWLDAGRDARAGRTDKPVAGGLIGVRVVRMSALVALAPAVVLPFLASVPAGAVHLLFLAAGWTYNLGLKATAASVLTYAVGFAALPSLAPLLLQPPRFAPWWATAAGAALGIAAHFANVVPDVAADRAAGIRGLPQVLGSRVAGFVAPAVLLVGTALVAAGIGPGSAVAGIATTVAAACAVAALVVAGLVAAGRRAPGRAPFLLVLVAALALVVVLLASGAALSG